MEHERLTPYHRRPAVETTRPRRLAHTPTTTTPVRLPASVRAFLPWRMHSHGFQLILPLRLTSLWKDTPSSQLAVLWLAVRLSQQPAADPPHPPPSHCFSTTSMRMPPRPRRSSRHRSRPPPPPRSRPCLLPPLLLPPFSLRLLSPLTPVSLHSSPSLRLPRLRLPMALLSTQPPNAESRIALFPKQLHHSSPLRLALSSVPQNSRPLVRHSCVCVNKHAHERRRSTQFSGAPSSTTTLLSSLSLFIFSCSRASLRPPRCIALSSSRSARFPSQASNTHDSSKFDWARK